jgi:hypothetical protein
MGRTTRPPPLDITTVFSELGRLARRAVRLHPRVGTPGPTAAPSAAPCCGPAGEFWPTCQEPHHGGVERILAPPEISALDQAEQWALATPGLSGIGREDDGAISAPGSATTPPTGTYPDDRGAATVGQRCAGPAVSPADRPFQLLWCPNDHDEPWWGHAR